MQGRGKIAIMSPMTHYLTMTYVDKFINDYKRELLVYEKFFVFLEALTRGKHIAGRLVNISGDFSCGRLWIGSVTMVTGTACAPALARSEHALSFVTDHKNYQEAE